MRKQNLLGQTFSRWTVVGEADSIRYDGGSVARWLCQCACGQTMVVRAVHLRSGRSRSCGCLQSEVAAKLKTVHGMRSHRLYDVWTQMLQRCVNPANSHYHLYGGRGIFVCTRWRDFASFAADMSPTYEPGLTIERRDNDGPYSADNCYWATHSRQARNQRKTVRVVFAGREVPLIDLAEAHGVKPHTAYSRYRLKGWTVEQALGLAPHPHARPARCQRKVSA